MPTNLRFTKKEENNLRKKCIQINKILIDKNKLPIRESELAHIILDKSITYVKTDSKGEIYIDI